MATTMAGAPITSGGFVLKSVRQVLFKKGTSNTFSVQNEGDFCFMINDDAYDSYYWIRLNKIDGVSVGNISTNKPIIFGKSVEFTVGGDDTSFTIYEYGPAE